MKCQTCNHPESAVSGPLAPKLRRKIDAKDRTLFTMWCPVCGSTGAKVTGGPHWLKHRDVYKMLEPHGSPFQLAPKVPELPS